MTMKLVDAEQLEADLTSVADKIRTKTGSEEKLAFPSGFESALDTIENADSALAEIESNMTNGYNDYSYMFYNLHRMTEVPVGILQHISNGQNFMHMFQYCGKLIEVPILDTSNGDEFRSMFYSCTALTTIESINLSNALMVSEMFYNCPSLENITFNGVIKITGLYLGFSPLTHDSLMSAINALYDWASEGSTSTYKLTLGSTNLAKLTDAEKAIATQKGWTLQ